MATGQYNSFPIDWKSIDATKVPYSNTSSGLSATDVQNAIDELNTDLNAIDASDIPYDNTASGLTADDVQEALDELALEKQDTLTAGDGIDITSDTISTDNDATLTSATKPAQAKAVGDALSAQETATEEALYTKAPVITDTASGPIASFPDGADGYPLKECVVDVDAVQDLHGYDHPWPAGGGKNLTSYDTPYVGTVGVNTQTVLFSATLTGGKTYTFSCKQSATIPTSTRNTFGVRPVGGATSYENTAENFNPTNLRHTKTFTVESTGVYEFIIWSHTPSVSVTYNEWQVEEGSSFTGYAPYSNICPITGWAQAKVADDPEYGGDIVWNQLIGVPVFTSPFTNNGVTFTKNTADNSVTVNGTVQGHTNAYAQISNNTGIVIGHKYYIRSGSDSGKVKIWYNGTGGITKSVETIGTITSIANGFYLRVDTEGTSVNETVRSQAFDLTLMFGEGNEPSTVEEFKTLFPKKYYPQDTAGTETYVSAVNGDPYRIVTIPFNTTCYGGVLDVTRGKLWVTHGSVDLGELIWHNLGLSGYGNRFYATFTPAKAPASLDVMPDLLCSEYPIKLPSDFNQPVFGITLHTNGYLQIYDASRSSMTDSQFQTAITGTQLVYELATPVEVDLTATELETLLGVNNIWADCGDVTVEYGADTKLFIQKLISALA